jgi:hypothetical protein
MGPGLFILFWLVIAALYSLAWFTCYELYRWLRKSSSTLTKIIGAIPLTAISCLGLAFLGLVVYMVIRNTNPHYVFVDTFQEAPMADIANIKSDVSWGSDYLEKFLAFDGNRETFIRLCAESTIEWSISENTLERYQDFMWSREPPHWWGPIVAGKSSVCFPFHERYDNAYLLFTPEHQEINLVIGDID